MGLTADTLQKLEALVAERQQLKAWINFAEDKIKNEMDPTIIMELALAGIKSTEVSALGKRWSCYQTENKGREYLDRMKLVEAGVTNEQLKKGTSVSKGSFGVTVKEIGGNGGNLFGVPQ